MTESTEQHTPEDETSRRDEDGALSQRAPSRRISIGADADDDVTELPFTD